MNDSAKNQDQSMEEILQSIKRIIAEEDTPPAGSDVLELTEMMEEEAAPPVMEAAEAEDLSALTMDEIMEAKRKEAEEALAAANAAKAKPAPKAPAPKAPEPVVVPAPEPVEIAEDEPLISEETFDAAASAFDKLKHLPDALPGVPHVDSMATRAGTTVEDLLLEALRPMLRDWLDSNLTQIVERLVEREVRKISAR